MSATESRLRWQASRERLGWNRWEAERRRSRVELYKEARLEANGKRRWRMRRDQELHQCACVPLKEAARLFRIHPKRSRGSQVGKAKREF